MKLAVFLNLLKNFISSPYIKVIIKYLISYLDSI